MPQANRLALGTAKQLLFDDALVEAKEGFTTTMNPATRTDTPVIAPERPWEQRGCSNPSVILDEGIYKMWYSATGEDGTPRDCYATSTDGIRWERPNLGLIDYRGSRENNIISFDLNHGEHFSKIHPLNPNGASSAFVVLVNMTMWRYTAAGPGFGMTKVHQKRGITVVSAVCIRLTESIGLAVKS